MSFGLDETRIHESASSGFPLPSTGTPVNVTPSTSRTSNNDVAPSLTLAAPLHGALPCARIEMAVEPGGRLSATNRPSIPERIDKWLGHTPSSTTSGDNRANSGSARSAIGGPNFTSAHDTGRPAESKTRPDTD